MSLLVEQESKIELNVGGF